MASEILGLFGGQSPQQLRNAFLDSTMVSPQQMAQQGLLQQVVSMGQNAGSMMGAGAGRLFGGKVAGEVEASYLEDSLAQVEKMGFKNDAEKMAALGDLLATKPGMGRQAMLARQEANKLKVQGYEMGAMERDENYRREFAALGANPTTAQITALDTKYGKVPEVRAAATAAEAKAEKKAATEKEAKRIKTIAEALVKRDSKLPPAFAEVIAGDPKALMDFVNPKVKTTFKNVGGRVGMYNSETGDLIKDIGAAGDSDVKALAGSVAALAQSMGEDQAQKAAQAGGQGVGEQIAQVNAGAKSLGYLTDALGIVDDGIYAGGYGPMQEAAAKYSKGVLGSKERLANTEEFRAYIGNVVIPMMSQLGGSDSNEELKKMEKIVAGDTTLEESAIRNILKSAQKAVRSDLEFLEKQQKAILEGKPLPTRRSKATEGVTASGTKYTIK